MNEYLFSTCIPKSFEDSQTMDVCNVVAKGNYFIDYSVADDNGTIDVWQGKKMNTFTIVVIIISAIMCIICSLSCFYNYRFHRAHEPPFPVPKFCPDCLFPKGDHRMLLEK
jgi:hypothetical protein